MPVFEGVAQAAAEAERLGQSIVELEHELGRRRFLPRSPDEDSWRADAHERLHALKRAKAEAKRYVESRTLPVGDDGVVKAEIAKRALYGLADYTAALEQREAALRERVKTLESKLAEAGIPH